MSDLPQECAVSDCLRLAHSGGKHCSAHAKQNQRGGITHAPVRERMPLHERVSHLCDELANADSEDDKARARAWDALRKAIEEFGAARWQHRAGKARMQALTPEERSLLGRRAVKARSRKLARNRRIAIAKKAASARWNGCSPAGRKASAPSQEESENTTPGKCPTPEEG